MAVVALLCTAMVFTQGVTTSAIRGQVTDSSGEPLPGAPIVAVHNPTSTTYGAAADFDGFFRISNMRAGGPYTVTITYVGFTDDVKNDIFLTLGRASVLSAQLSESATALDEVVVTSSAVFGSTKTGAATTIGRRDVNTLPAASRSIADFIRITPQAQLTEGNDGFSVSLAGENKR